MARGRCRAARVLFASRLGGRKRRQQNGLLFRPKGGAEVATVEEVANLAVYVASPLSPATTGAALRVDGGVVDTIA
jgi:NAD(P)-dependent dehydrogenase (short-subunit alcohol dehydrogenase family)